MNIFVLMTELSGTGTELYASVDDVGDGELAGYKK